MPLRAFYTWPGFACAALIAALWAVWGFGVLLFALWTEIRTGAYPFWPFVLGAATGAMRDLLLLGASVPVVAWLLGGWRRPFLLAALLVAGGLSLALNAFFLQRLDVTAFLYTTAASVVVSVVLALPAALLWQRFGDPRPARLPDASTFD